MPGMTQRIQLVGSQNQMRNAEKLARDWAVAHAGSYHDPARKALGGALPIRRYEQDNLTISLSKPMSPVIKQCQLVSVRYRHTGIESPYVSYLMTYTPAESTQPGGYLVSVTNWPAALQADMLPWNDKAGFVGLDSLIQKLNAGRSRSRQSDANATRPISGIDDLFSHGSKVVVLTEESQQDSDFLELAEKHADWANVLVLSASEQLSIGRELLNEQLYQWIRAKIALFSQDGGNGGEQLLMADTDYEYATGLLEEERSRSINEVPNRNALLLMELLESTTAILAVSLATDAKVMAEAIVESTTQPRENLAEVDRPDNVAMQQRVYVLEDRLAEAKAAITLLQEKLEQYEYQDTDAEAEETDSIAKNDDTVDLDANRVLTVIGGITAPERFPKLRFLTNCTKPLEDYGKPRPNGVEILAALDAINRLAQAWYNTPSRSISPWVNYFVDLTGWKYADSESAFTMSRYGDKRSFSDQEQGRLVTIERHLTYQGSSGGLQIYFDRDDITDTFIVGYIGEHLPYSTARS